MIKEREKARKGGKSRWKSPFTQGSENMSYLMTWSNWGGTPYIVTSGRSCSVQPYRGDSVLDSTRQVYNLGNGGFPVHHDPVHGICTNHEKWQWGLSPFSIFGVCAYPMHRVMVNWEPSSPAGWRQVPDHDGSDHDGTRNMSRGVNLLYLFRY